MDVFELIDNIEEKLLFYQPIKDIYFVEKHKLPFSNIKWLCEEVESKWGKIIKNFTNVLNCLCLYIDEDDYLNNAESYINDGIFDLNEAIKTVSLNDIEFDKKEKITKITLLLNLYACCVVPQGNPKYLLEDGTFKFSFKSNNVYFRGEDSYDYSLLPSIYRNEIFDEKGKTLNYSSFLFPFYHSRGLLQKYNNFQKYEEIDYSFCSLMQHAGCKSPLLDITKNSKIAVSFASDKNRKHDGSLYVFSDIKEIDASENMKRLSIFAINKKLDYLTIIRRTRIIFCGLDKFDVEFKILTSQTNDRMKFQEGAFLYINKCIIVNKKLLLPISNKKIKKYRVTSTYKNKYQDSAEPRYQVRYLMDPYSYLKDDLFNNNN